jgi:hypothetical protein
LIAYSFGSRSNIDDKDTFKILQISNSRAALTRFSAFILLNLLERDARGALTAVGRSRRAVQSLARRGKALPAPKRSETVPYVWVHPDDDR